jgi:hypothetical protein
VLERERARHPREGEREIDDVRASLGENGRSTSFAVRQREMVEVAVETGRSRMMLVAAGVAVALLAVVGVVVSSVSDEADAADTTRLTVLWADVGSDGFLNLDKGSVSATRTGIGTYEVRTERDLVRAHRHHPGSAG